MYLTPMQDKVFPTLWCLDMSGCHKFVHEVMNWTTQNHNTLSQIKAGTAKPSHVLLALVLYGN